MSPNNSVQPISPTPESQNSNSSPFTGELAHVLGELKKEVNHLATDDFSSVVHSVTKRVEDRMMQNPYQTLGLALGFGFGLGALNRTHAKSAAIRIGKLVAMKALSNLESHDSSERDAV